MAINGGRCVLYLERNKKLGRICVLAFVRHGQLPPSLCNEQRIHGALCEKLCAHMQHECLSVVLMHRMRKEFLVIERLAVDALPTRSVAELIVAALQKCKGANTHTAA